MSRHLTREVIADQANVVAVPTIVEALQPVQVDRSFEMPTGLYVATAACYLAFLAILVTSFSSPGLILPMAIIGVLIAGFFGVPAAWTRMAPGSAKRAMSSGQFSRGGIMTLTGRLSAGEATVQMLILPVLIVLWALAVVTIAALI
ncbi:hypothetical protein [Allopontixanthobacter sediminis]|uniref:Uncharacterized protein n=1 Tax=Allopontixanthobacter sediminis TaxID=1689985 RepID=A0A845B2H2_9SPHN|nr:hypothetical protein [Allopontixanthobacter sediminis]MXP45461.1 hypothetical protein [Allopontixanthobacter sediminis]